jgi:hypothetical protein
LSQFWLKKRAKIFLEKNEPILAQKTSQFWLKKPAEIFLEKNEPILAQK